MTYRGVQFSVHFAVHQGKLEAFESVAETMAAGSSKEPGTLAYGFCMNDDRTQCRLFEAYTDGNAVLAHLTGPVVKELVPRLLETASLTTFEVYGDPGPEASLLLTSFGATVFRPRVGFAG